jgi:hypothetical protein
VHNLLDFGGAAEEHKAEPCRCRWPQPDRYVPKKVNDLPRGIKAMPQNLKFTRELIAFALREAWRWKTSAASWASAYVSLTGLDAVRLLLLTHRRRSLRQRYPRLGSSQLP